MNGVLPTFFFFGCWNKDPNAGKNDNRAMVIKDLNDRSNFFSFGIIAGDNVYPVKNVNSSSKTYYKNTLVRGKALLNKVVNNKTMFNNPFPIVNNPKKKYVGVAVGNHNAAEAVSAAERQIFTDPFKLYEAPATYYPYPDDNFKLYEFIFINTNLCAQKVAGELQRCLARCRTNHIYVIGHEPLVAAKAKKDKLFAVLEGAQFIVDVLFDAMIGDRHIAYLCADVHNFQSLVIARKCKTIPIIVCGTGGAEPDIVPEGVCLNKTYTVNGLRDCKLKLIIKAQPYGYCLINGFNVKYFTFNKETVPNHASFKNWNFSIEKTDIKDTANFPSYDYKTPLYTPLKK